MRSVLIIVAISPLFRRGGNVKEFKTWEYILPVCIKNTTVIEIDIMMRGKI